MVGTQAHALVEGEWPAGLTAAAIPAHLIKQSVQGKMTALEKEPMQEKVIPDTVMQLAKASGAQGAVLPAWATHVPATTSSPQGHASTEGEGGRIAQWQARAEEEKEEDRALLHLLEGSSQDDVLLTLLENDDTTRRLRHC